MEHHAIALAMVKLANQACEKEAAINTKKLGLGLMAALALAATAQAIAWDMERNPGKTQTRMYINGVPHWEHKMKPEALTAYDGPHPARIGPAVRPRQI